MGPTNLQLRTKEAMWEGQQWCKCLPAMYSTHSISYIQVCGRVLGYVYHAPDGLGQFAGPQTIEGMHLCRLGVPHTWTSCSKTTHQSDTPSLLIQVAAMGKYKQINNSDLRYVNDVISLIIHERNYAILLLPLMPCFLP